jgi:hypothetical protein
MKKSWLVPLALLLAGCGGGENRIALEAEPLSDETYIHDERAPRIRFEEAALSSARLPALPGGAALFTARLPVGAGEGPRVLVAVDGEGNPAEDAVWIDPEGRSDFTAVPPWRLVPYEDYEGWYTTESPVAVSYPVETDEGARTGEESFDVLVNVHPGGAGLRLYPSDAMVGTFPESGVRFLLYDGDRNGVYEAEDPLVIDANGDGEFDGNRNSVELYRADEPFLVAGEAYRLGTIAWDGSFVTLVPTDEAVPERKPLLAGDPAPDFTLTDLEGNEVRFSEVSSGRPVMLAYWATW